MRYIKTGRTSQSLIPECHGAFLYDGRIEYNHPLALAHELGHAIEVTLNGRTSEYGAWALAYSFLKPKFWDGRMAQRLYNTYVERGEHMDEYVIDLSKGAGHKSYGTSRAPESLDFVGGVQLELFKRGA